VLCAAILVVLERFFPSGRELGADVDGDLGPQEPSEPPVRPVLVR
jgi:hypothetical protein